MTPPINQLRDIVAQLRAPGGCPWDIEQTPKSISPHIIEEAYELVDAIESNDMEKIKDELSDKLLHVVMLAEMISETGAFDFDDVATHCSEKMIRRHPHVFGSSTAETTNKVNKQWEEIKLNETTDKSDLLDNVPNNFPALLHAHKIQKKVATVGFDWPDVSGAIDKLIEECHELAAATTESDRDEEIGDILFTLVNICRKQGRSAEDLLQATNKKFKERFKLLESIINSKNENIQALPIETLELYWDQAKKLQK